MPDYLHLLKVIIYRKSVPKSLTPDVVFLVVHLATGLSLNYSLFCIDQAGGLACRRPSTRSVSSSRERPCCLNSSCALSWAIYWSYYRFHVVFTNVQLLFDLLHRHTSAPNRRPPWLSWPGRKSPWPEQLETCWAVWNFVSDCRIRSAGPSPENFSSWIFGKWRHPRCLYHIRRARVPPDTSQWSAWENDRHRHGRRRMARFSASKRCWGPSALPEGNLWSRGLIFLRPPL